MQNESTLKGVEDEVVTTREVNGFKTGDLVVVTGKIVGWIQSYGRFAAIVEVEPTTPQKLKKLEEDEPC